MSAQLLQLPEAENIIKYLNKLLFPPIMKKSIILLMVFLICLNTALASITLSEYECEDERCKEGTKVKFIVGVFNNINKTIKVNDIIIKNSETLDPIYTYEHEGMFLETREKNIFEFTETIIAPKEGYTHYYVPCFKTSIWVDGKTTGGGEVCDRAVKSFTVLPLSKVECEDDSECEPWEYCDTKFFKCKQNEEVIVVQQEDKNGKYDDLKYYLLTAFVVVFVIVVSYWLIIKEK